jgi:hypothetical protein
MSIRLVCSERTIAYGMSRSYISTRWTTISILVRTLYSIMGALQIAILTNIINHAMRLRLTDASMRLDTVRLLTALSLPFVS